MSFNYVISAQEESVWVGNAPTANSIDTAFAQAMASAQGTMGVSGIRWVNTSPRITRILVAGAASANVTRAASLLEVDGPYTQDRADQIATGVANALYLQLTPQSSDWAMPLVTPYDTAVNGPVEFWACTTTGAECASVTQTRDTFPELGGRFDANENPIGPTTPFTHPTTIAGALGAGGGGSGPSPIGQATDFLKTAAWVIGGATVLYLAWPLLTGIRAGTSMVSEGVKARARSSRQRSRTMARSRTSYGF